MRLRWIIACILGEALGMAAVALAYAAVHRGLADRPSAWIMAAGAWEGLSLGAAQALILRGAGVPAAAWILRTALAAAAGYGIILLAGTQLQALGEPEPSLAMICLYGAGIGLGMGALIGALQQLVARGRIAAGPWIGANALGWAPAMALIMAAAASAQPGWSLAMVALAGGAAGAAAGLCVGAATGLALPRTP